MLLKYSFTCKLLTYSSVNDLSKKLTITKMHVDSNHSIFYIMIMSYVSWFHRFLCILAVMLKKIKKLLNSIKAAEKKSTCRLLQSNWCFPEGKNKKFEKKESIYEFSYWIRDRKPSHAIIWHLGKQLTAQGRFQAI